MAKKKTGEVFKLMGVEELEKALHDLHDDMKKNIIWNACGHGAEVIRERMASEAPVDEANLQKSIIKKRAKSDDPIKPIFRIGPSREQVGSPKGKTTSHLFPHVYAGFLEWGTYKMTANPFMSRAAEGSASEAHAKIISVLRRRLALAAKKAARLKVRSYL